MTYDLLAAHLSGQCTAQQSELVERWLQASPENRLVLERLRLEWAALGDGKDDYVPPKKEIKQRIMRQIGRKGNNQRMLRFYKAVSLVASVALLLLTLGTYFYKKTPMAEQLTTVMSSSGSKTQILLPDSTEVTLNVGSKLTYSNLFGQANRKLMLDGEAYFKVHRNPEQKCLVQSGGIEVEVLGTTFNVQAHQLDSTISISLFEGSINVNSITTGRLLSSMLPNEMIVIQKADHSFQLTKGNIADNAIWTQSSLRFHNEPIDTICAKLEKWYGVKIHLVANKSSHRYTFVVKSESLKEVFDLLNQITPLRYEIKGKEASVVISG